MNTPGYWKGLVLMIWDYLKLYPKIRASGKTQYGRYDIWFFPSVSKREAYKKKANL